MLRRTTLLCALLASGGLTMACSNSEAPAEDHTPVSIVVAVNNVPVADDTVRLNANATDTVRISFFNAASEDLDHAEADHYSLLTFNPATGITATVDPSHHFRSAVVATAPAGTAGDLAIGYGHDAAADEYSFAVKFKVE